MYCDTKKLYPKFTEAIDHSEPPSSVRDAEQLIIADTELKEAFANKMVQSLLSVDEFLETLKRQQAGSTMEMALDTKEPIKLMSSLKLISQDLREVQNQLVNFWQVHKACMDHLIQVCHLLEDAEKVLLYFTIII